MTFDPAAHEYRDDTGLIIPSVTQVLKAAGYIDNRWYNVEARDRGSAVHELARRFANGERYDAAGRKLEGLEYVNAISRWFDTTGAYAISTETMICGESNGQSYAGMFDLLAEIGGKRVLVDYKTGAKAKWHPLQMGAYAMAKIAATGEPVNPDMVIIMYAKVDGRYTEDRLYGARLVDAIRGFREAIR